MRLLLTGAFDWKPQYIQALQNHGFQVMLSEREDSELDPSMYQAEAVVCNWLFVHHSIEDFPELRYVQLTSAGTDRIPENYIRQANITLRTARGVYSRPMAEYAVGAVLQLYKGSTEFYKNQKQHLWQKNRRCRELSGERVCIIGAGSVGTETARLFSAFTPEVYGIDLYPRENSCFREVFPIDRLDEQIGLSDIVILTLPLTDETWDMFDKKRFAAMKEKSVFINIARGGLVDETALSEALDNRLFGAAVDVFRQEPLSPDSDLWDKKNLIITPHNSFVSDRNEERMWQVIYNNLAEYFAKPD